MKIIHIISGGDTGGAKTHLLTLLRELNKTTNCELLCMMEGKFTVEATALNVKTTIIKQRSRFDINAISQMQSFVVAGNFDIIHCHGARANFIALFLKLKVKKPFITTIHSDYKLDFINSFYKKIIYTPINTFAVKRFDYYCSITNNFTQMLINRGFNPKKIFTIYNGINIHLENKIIPKNIFLEKYNIPFNENNIYVGLAARLHSVKGIDFFLKAAKNLINQKNIIFLIAGTGDEKDKFIKFAKENNLTNIHFLGHINDIFSFYNAIDINTLTSLSESFPYALLEGGLLKKATIASKAGGIPEMIDDGENGLLFSKGDFAELSQLILKLSENKNLRELYGNNFYEKIIRCFSSEKMAELHIEIYKKILN